MNSIPTRTNILVNNKVFNIMKNDLDTPKIIIYLHSLGNDLSEAQTFFNSELVSKYQLIALELRGHGSSELKATSFFQTYLEDILDLILYYKSLDKEVYLIGSDLGAAMASLIAFEFKNAINSVFAFNIPRNLKYFTSKLSSKKRAYLAFDNFFNSVFRQQNYHIKIQPELLSDSVLFSQIYQKLDNNFLINSKVISISNTFFKMFWKKSISKKPNSPIYYFASDKDLLIENQLIEKNDQKISQHIEITRLENQKHYLFFDLEQNQIIDKIIYQIEK